MPNLAETDFLRLKLGNGSAPHKPILLLAVLRAFDRGLIIENRIEPSAELIDLFFGHWARLVPEGRYQRRFFLPFFHLRSERSGLWKLHAMPGFETHALTRARSVKSLGALLAFQAWAELRPDVYQRWLVPENRAADRLIIMARYFPGQSLPHELPSQLGLFEQQVQHDSPETYVARQLQLLQHDEEEEQVLRGAAFKRKVPELYTYTCAFTGLHVSNARNTRLVDACHIVPWADSFDDTITNGIALSPTLHRAFDRGMIGIADDYSVIVAHDLRETDSPHAIRPLHGQKLYLPRNNRHWPDRRNLAKHRERWGL